MALTNPNTPVSEQDLHDFYNRIKPYLGGGGGGGSLPAGGTTGQSLVKHSDSDNDAEWFDVNKEISFDDFNELTQEEKDNGTSYYIPDATVVSNLTIMGNRFDKANIYTDTERMIGSWMGKPLYQKTISCGAMPNASSKAVAHNISNIEFVISIGGTFHRTDGDFWCELSTARTTAAQTIMVTASKTNIDITTGYNWASNTDISYVTLQYTKTTDTTVNIGTGNDYSTDEQIIGTWIDGKPIYQKTIDLGNLPNNNVTHVNTGISNPKRLINYFATATDSNGGNISFPRLWIGGTGDIYIGFGANLSTVNIATTSDRSGMTGYCTLQYTKTTD